MFSLLKFVRLLLVCFLSVGLCQQALASDLNGGKTPLAIENRSDESTWNPFQHPANESEERTALMGELDTLKYDEEDDDTLWIFTIPDKYGDDLFNVRFTPAWDYQLKSALFLFDSKTGTGAVRIYVWESDGVYPAQKRDSVDVPDTNIQFYPDWTTVDFSSKNITLRSISDFHIGYTPLGPPETDTVAILSDDGLPVGEHRSIESWDGVWGTIFDDWGGKRDYNFMIRAVVEKTSDVEEEQFTVANPTRYELLQSYPNPFNPETRIKYTIDSRQTHSIPITLKIYNILGQLVKTLVDQAQEPGSYEVIWDGKDEKGNDVVSGIYFYQLTTGEFSQTKKMILIK